MRPHRPTAAPWTDPSGRRRRLAAIAGAFTLLLGLVGCGGDDDDQQVLDHDSGISQAQVVTREQRILNQRARAVRERDLAMFLRRVDH
jgi:hypothetical protein